MDLYEKTLFKTNTISHRNTHIIWIERAGVGHSVPPVHCICTKDFMDSHGHIHTYTK